MINEIKTIVKNYIKNEKLTRIIDGSVTDDGIKISEKLTIPLELIKGSLKKYITSGDKVKMVRNEGGQEFYIVEIIDADPVIKGMTLSIEPIIIGETTIDSIKINGVTL